MVSARHKKLKQVAEKSFLKKCKDQKRKPTAKEQKKAGSAQGNLHMRFLRALMNFAMTEYRDGDDKPILSENPVKKLSDQDQWHTVKRRKTIIKDHQLPAWFQAVTNLKNETVRDYLLFVFLTGCRKTEALVLEIEQIDLKSKTCTFLDTKTDEELTLPLGIYLFEMVEARIKKLGKAKYLFPGNGPKGHFTEPKKQVAKIVGESGVQFTLHDLRRVFVTTCDALDLSNG